MQWSRAGGPCATPSTSATGVDFNYLPIGIYAIPEMASVGLSEEDARKEYGDIIVGKARMSEIARAQISGATTGLLKLVIAPDGKKIARGPYRESGRC